MLYKVIVEFPSVTRGFDNSYQDRWMFDMGLGDGELAEAEALRDLLEEFYFVAVPLTGDQVAQYLGSDVSLLDVQYHFYNQPVGGGPTGSPIFELGGNQGAVIPLSTDNAPLDCCSVLSYNADLTGVPEQVRVNNVLTRPAQRRRGHISLGPLNLAAIQTGVDMPILADEWCQTVVVAAKRMGDAAQLLGELTRWVVWSQADGVARPVIEGACNAKIATRRSHDIPGQVQGNDFELAPPP